MDLFLDARAEGGEEIDGESGFSKSGVKVSISQSKIKTEYFLAY